MRVLIFICLKVLEIVGILLVAGVASAIVLGIAWLAKAYIIAKIILALIYLAIIGVLLWVFCKDIIQPWLASNWRKAGELEKRWKRGEKK